MTGWMPGVLAIALSALALTPDAPAPAAAPDAVSPVAGPAIDAAVDAAGAVQAVPAFDPARDAAADVDAALAAAQASGRHVMIIFGGDWCHDSWALTDLFAEPRFADMLAQRYEIVRVAVPRSLDQRRIAVGHRLGLGDIVGTPTVLILDPAGRPTNLSDAPRWRNAASRKADAVYRHFSRAAPAVGPATP